MAALQGTGIGTNPESNYFSFLARKPNEGKIPHPSEMITGSSHTYVIDSRERDLKSYPNPACYSIKFNTHYKNVTSIELKGSIIPKTEYNINTGNNFIPFNIQDYITKIELVDAGGGYKDGVYGSTSPDPENVGKVTISPPAITGGTQALITVTVQNGYITQVTLDDPGTGYLCGFYGGMNSPGNGFYLYSGAAVNINIPVDRTRQNQQRQAKINVKVGNVILARLRPGQYDFASPNDSEPGLCREVTRALQEAAQNAIEDGIFTPLPGGPTTGAQVFPYVDTDPNDGSCYLTTTNENASPNVQVCIQRGKGDGTYNQSPFLELLWSYEETFDSSAVRILGYGSSVESQKFSSGIKCPPMDQTNNTLEADTWSIKPIIARNDYDITDSPLYCILSFSEYSSVGDRVESTNAILDKAFATIVFDANGPNVIYREPQNPTPSPGTGPSNYSSLLFKPGMLKAIKGQDFDSKVLSFGPAPIAELNGITICFRKFNGDLLDFHGRDHLLIFNINAEDVNSGNKW